MGNKPALAGIEGGVGVAVHGTGVDEFVVNSTWTNILALFAWW